MDNYLDKNRFQSLYYTNALKDAKNLKEASNRAVTKYLKNFHTRYRFLAEIEGFIQSQLYVISNSKNEDVCRECLLNLKEENNYIEDQMHSLMNGRSKTVASAALVKELDTWGYMINGVGVVIGGFLKKGYIETANFLGFDNKTGSIAYSAMDLALSGYGLGRLVLKPDAFRLFKYIPADFIRNYRIMTAPALAIEATGDGLSIRSAVEAKN
ncbi:DUF4225 domain-containing protein [Erwinia aphidicola]|uniref:DUF4225 domain-containing protein n=2 Tax=Erwinia aphidicola TaxID=68334 RepID=UPI0030CE5805